MLCIFPLLIALTGFLIKFINKKSNELEETRTSEKEKKYIQMLNSTITDCVIATTQTYVESLKAQGKTKMYIGLSPEVNDSSKGFSAVFGNSGNKVATNYTISCFDYITAE